MPNLVNAPDRVNDFVVKFANVNGTGSASANSLIMKAIFRMGVPVTGKNYFPSNIQGLPTWYEIRVTRDGYAARAGRVDIMVAMNAETYSKNDREGASGDDRLRVRGGSLFGHGPRGGQRLDERERRQEAETARVEYPGTATRLRLCQG